MIETVTENRLSTGVSIAAGKITSLRNVQTQTTAVRVYDNGLVAVAGQEGKADIETLKKRAKENLAVCGVPYPCMPLQNVKHVDRRKRPIERPQFLEAMRDLLNRLHKAAPQFLFGNKIKLIERSVHYQNDAGSDLTYADDFISIELTVKERNSANIMDFSYGDTIDRYDPQSIVDDVTALTQAYLRPVELPSDIPVAFGANSVVGMLLSDMIADSYMAGSGRLKGKLGEKLFHDALNVAVRVDPVSRAPQPVFDAEGVLLDDEGFKLIENGTFRGLLSTKRSAAQFGIPLSGGAHTGAYDSIPTYGGSAMTVRPTARSIADLSGRALYVLTASGGDLTDRGDMGLPVQAALLLENGKFVGRLPECMLSGNIFNVLGKDFVGVAENAPVQNDPAPQLVARMRVSK